ncbi:twin-arginine translocation signal domain-containing protein [Aeromonas caviae]|uniref:twin-arginine translocation signal domain-containing protein n=1 Tax=Aeromonas caviae TaxID=648 RepID=UPI0025B6F664|nr:twin-arginine translocation signal domain-containing protein [Aeromonas caviae]
MSRFDERDSANHPRDQEPAFNRLIEAVLSRRGFLKGVGAGLVCPSHAADEPLGLFPGPRLRFNNTQHI